MKNLIKSIISYTALVGVPIICIGSITASAYSVGRDDGVKEAMMFAKESVKETTKKNEE